MKDPNEINVPLDDRLTISYNNRVNLFYNLLENYNLYFENMKLLYAALNFNNKFKSDYIVIFESSRDGIPIIIYDIATVYSTRSMPSYMYAVKNNLYNQFFYTCSKNFCMLTRDKFIEYLKVNDMALSQSKPNYWKSPDNQDKLLEILSELKVGYIPQGFTKGI